MTSFSRWPGSQAQAGAVLTDHCQTPQLSRCQEIVRPCLQSMTEELSQPTPRSLHVSKEVGISVYLRTLYSLPPTIRTAAILLFALARTTRQQGLALIAVRLEARRGEFNWTALGGLREPVWPNDFRCNITDARGGYL